MNPLEVKEHIKRLWDVEGDLLDLIFGTLDIQKKRFESQAIDIFFMNNILVSPNRFRPETSGGKQAQDDREYLHAHSAMLTRILNTNAALRRAIEVKEGLTQPGGDENQPARQKYMPKLEDYSDKEITSKEVIKNWIDLQDAINTYLDSSLASRAENREKPGLRQLLEK